MQINFRDIRNNSDTVRVWRNRHRGDVEGNNTFVLYKRRGLPHKFELFIEPNPTYSAAELGGRLMQDLAETVVAVGEIRISREPLINVEFISPDVAQEEVAYLIAEAFKHNTVVDLHARVTLKSKPFMGVATVAELIRRF